MLLLFPLVVIASFFGKLKGGNMIYKICRVWGDVWWFLIGIYHKNIYESEPDKGKQYIFVANHNSYMDIPTIFKAIRRRDVRVLGKAEMKAFPVFGFIYSKAVVMVDRANIVDRSKSVRQMKSILNRNISIFIYPEGTFNETGRPLKDFYDGAFRIAIETQTSIIPILFLDSYDRMDCKSIFDISPGRSRAVFLDEVEVYGLSLKDVSKLKKKIYEQMEQSLIVYHHSLIKKNILIVPDSLND
jgi:1-acyl-sn-glycerol-3-phosphate acyltransferase